MPRYVYVLLLVIQLYVIAGKLLVKEQPEDATQKHGLLGRLNDGGHTLNDLHQYIFIQTKPNQQLLCTFVYMLYIQILLSPGYHEKICGVS